MESKKELLNLINYVCSLNKKYFDVMLDDCRFKVDYAYDGYQVYLQDSHSSGVVDVSKYHTSCKETIEYIENKLRFCGESFIFNKIARFITRSVMNDRRNGVMEICLKCC